MSHQKHDVARGWIDHRTGVAARVGPVVPDHGMRAPRSAAVVRTLDEHVDVPGVRPAILAPFTERQHRSRPGLDDRRDTVGVVAVDFAFPDHDGLNARHRLERGQIGHLEANAGLVKRKALGQRLGLALS